MTLSRDEAKQLALPAAIAIALVAAGAALIWYSDRTQIAARNALAAATTERTQNREKLARIAEEEREVREKMEVYRQLKDLRIVGPERRLEWADTVNRARVEREITDLRYTVEPRKLLATVGPKEAAVDFHASTMKLNASLLHEGDLLRLLGDLRNAGNAYYAIRSCSLRRTPEPAAAATLAPRVAGECVIDLITIVDRGAKT